MYFCTGFLRNAFSMFFKSSNVKNFAKQPMKATWISRVQTVETRNRNSGVKTFSRCSEWCLAHCNVGVCMKTVLNVTVWGFRIISLWFPEHLGSWSLVDRSHRDRKCTENPSGAGAPQPAGFGNEPKNTFEDKFATACVKIFLCFLFLFFLPWSHKPGHLCVQVL